MTKLLSHTASYFSLHKSVRTLAKRLGLELRFGLQPSDVMTITKVEAPVSVAAAYFIGTGVIWIKSPFEHTPEEMNVVVLHEIGHAIMDGLKQAPADFIAEVQANAIALALASVLDIPIPDYFPVMFAKFASQKEPKRTARKRKK